MMTFAGGWIGASVVLIVLTGIISWYTNKDDSKKWNILIDARGRYSLNRLQVVTWTILIFSTLFALVATNLDNLTVAFNIPKQLLILMGIGLGSGTLAGAVKSNKDLTSTCNIQNLKTSWLQFFLEEEGEGADKVISISKFQSFIITILLAGVYVYLTFKNSNYPVFDENILWFLGISQGGYIGGKMPNKK